MIHILKSNKNYRYYWAASCVSTIGDYIDDIAFAQLVYLITESTLLTSYVFAIKIVFTFLSIFTATYVDKYNKKRILVFTSLAQGSILAFLLILYRLNCLNAPILIIFVTLQTVFSSFSTPAQNAILSCIVSKEDMLNARSSISIFMRFIQIISYLCAGAIIASIGIGGAILLDAITFLVSAILISFVVNKEESSQKFVSVHDYFKNVREGFHFVASNKTISNVLVVTFLGNALIAPVDGLMPAYFTQGEYNDYAYATFMVGISIGGIIGTWVLTKLQSKLSNEKLFSLGFCLGAVGMGLLYINHVVMTGLAAVFIGASVGFVSILNATILQLATPNAMIARIFSIFKCISFISSPIGIIFFGFTGEFLRMKVVFALCAILMLFTSFLTLSIVKEVK